MPPLKFCELMLIAPCGMNYTERTNSMACWGENNRERFIRLRALERESTLFAILRGGRRRRSKNEGGGGGKRCRFADHVRTPRHTRKQISRPLLGSRDMERRFRFKGRRDPDLEIQEALKKPPFAQYIFFALTQPRAAASGPSLHLYPTECQALAQ